MFQSIADFFNKMGDKNPELCLVIVFALLLTGIFLFFTWKSNSVTQTLFADYKETVKLNTSAMLSVCEVVGGVKEAIHKCMKQEVK